MIQALADELNRVVDRIDELLNDPDLQVESDVGDKLIDIQNGVLDTLGMAGLIKREGR